MPEDLPISQVPSLQPELLGDVVGPFTATRVRKVSEGLNVLPRVAVAAAYTIKTVDYIIEVTGGLPLTLTLPKAAVAGKGRVFVIKDAAGGAGTNNITIDGDGSETIDGTTTKVISTNYGAVWLYSSGTAWFTI